MTAPTKHFHAPRVLFSEQQSGQYTIGTVAVDNPRTLNALDLSMLRAMESKLL